MAAVVDSALHAVSAVQTVGFARRLAGAECWHFSFVVCAARALAALRVPPFRIWHDLFSLWLLWQPLMNQLISFQRIQRIPYR